ncbi:50S ribosomal protein L23 [Chitinivibrio alkaliphilus]|uniref:Large ribosomal subunit protein uL23 n=1 Tax=Chitinivibrio alkaliphilus ACht1 TaxID=1313304 RepID=U7D6U7_9BACT|nr:50S ribosomal protein L23 [Chitinivibrio alkaliphilus]ERP31291.1 50S ribosomal protein L2 [Chitinivibrio alkaliphilus ACht1]
MSRLHSIISAPLITEKTVEQQQEGKYAFKVRKDSTKVEIKEAVEKLFDVTVVSVNTANYTGKTKRVGRSVGKRSDWKKAYVQLQDGESIKEFGEL